MSCDFSWCIARLLCQQHHWLPLCRPCCMVLQLLEVLRELLDTAIKAQAQLKATIQQKAAEGKGAAAQQRALQAASNAQGAPQLSGSHRVIEVLIPLAAKPGFKAVMLEGKAVGMMAKYLHKLAIRSKDEPGCHVVVGLLLQLLAALGNVDVSLTPLNPRYAAGSCCSTEHSIQIGCTVHCNGRNGKHSLW